MERKKKSDLAAILHIEHELLEGRSDLYGGRTGAGSGSEALSLIEELIIRQLDDEWIPLRLLCLLSLSQDGIPTHKEYERWLTLYVQSYGYEHIVTFLNLRRLGLFTVAASAPDRSSYGSNSLLQKSSLSASRSSSSSSISTLSSAFRPATQLPQSVASLASNLAAKLITQTQYRTVLKKFNQLPPSAYSTSGSGASSADNKYDAKNREDAAYVFGGTYIPLICKLIEIFILNSPVAGSGTSSGTDELMKLLPGEFFSYRKPAAHRTSTVVTTGAGRVVSAAMHSIEADRKSVLVLAMGGITQAEVSALRLMADKFQLQLLICTTCILNGNTLLRQVSHLQA